MYYNAQLQRVLTMLFWYLATELCCTFSGPVVPHDPISMSQMRQGNQHQ